MDPTQERIDRLEQKLGKFCETEPQNVRTLERLRDEAVQVKEWETQTGRVFNRGGPK